jgi:hypothetical protein
MATLNESFVRGSFAGNAVANMLMPISIGFTGNIRKSLCFYTFCLRFLLHQVTVNNKRKLRKKQKLQKKTVVAKLALRYPPQHRRIPAQNWRVFFLSENPCIAAGI